MTNVYTPAVSIIVRTLNEAKFLPECLKKIGEQKYGGPIDIVVVDSGSTDNTVRIAANFNAKIVHISKSEFTFGRSLNVGCEASSGEILVLLSAHCIPCDENWLNALVKPLLEKTSEYSYGRQIPRKGVSKFSEGMVFSKYYPEHASDPQAGYFCNNANSAILRATWQRLRFDEKLTGLEDMELAKRLVDGGGTVSYVASSAVEHIHEESWSRIKIRYEREAAALVDIEPNLNLSLSQALKLFFLSTVNDFKVAEKKFSVIIFEIIFYRACQYYGSFLGSRASKLRISRMRQEYFYPKIQGKVVTLGERNGHDCATSNESS